MKVTIATKLSDKTTTKDIIAFLLQHRGITPSLAQEFFHPKKPYDMTLSDVGLSEKMFEKAFKRIKKALDGKESVVVYTDYDVDGITGGAVLWQTLHALGVNVMPYIPDRKTEGYGFSHIGVKRIIEKFHPSLVISVDHGISGEPFIKELKEKNIDVIVCDHHVKLLGDPESAYAIMYSKLICGAGVSYFFSKELAKRFEINDGDFKEEYVTLAGIGTISDIMPMNGPSRSLAHYGLMYLKTVKSIGMRALLKSAGILEKDKFTAYDIGFLIGPRINAAGRMGDALDALRLLCAKSENHAQELVSSLKEKNSQRQSQVETLLGVAEECLEGHREDKIIFVYSPLFEEGTVGLVAAKLMEKYYRPVLVATVSDGHLKGSARSIVGVDITHLFKSTASFLESYGGHERAGGFLLSHDKLAAFSQALQQYAKENISEALLERKTAIDILMPLSAVSLHLAHELTSFEPFGVSNEEPVFLSESVTFHNLRPVGKTGTHIQCFVSDATRSEPIKSIFFNGSKQLSLLQSGKPLSIVYTIGIDVWRGEQVAIHIKDVFAVA